MMSSSAVETCRGASNNSNMNKQLAIDVMQRMSLHDQFVMELLDLRSGDWNNPELSELVRSCYVSALESMEFCETLPYHLQSLTRREYEGASVSARKFLDQLSCACYQQRLLWEKLLSFANSSVEELYLIGYWKKVYAASFNTAAAVTAAVAAASAAVAAANGNLRKPVLAAAAAAASVLLLALGKWINSLVKKRESSVKKHKEIIGVMILGAKTSVKGLTSIDGLARRLQLATESMLSETVDGKKVAAVMKELQGHAKDYGRAMNLVGAVVNHTIFKD